MSRDYGQVGTGRTAGSVILSAGFLALAALVPSEADAVLMQNPSVRRCTLESAAQDPTAGLLTWKSADEVLASSALNDEIIATYNDFAAAQIPLEPDFAKALSENLWDLYIR